ncbi:hypothetical protein K1719_021098 [Acacia pycnantha]|nr:hypothetical protein K1719_021098 [Acacia pycnantha]
MNIKSFYGIKRNWQGDPYTPQAYLWDGLNYSYGGSGPQRITSLEWFHSYEPISRGSVYMCENKILDVAGIGIMRIKMHDGVTQSIQNVRHVKGLKKNLLSLRQFDDNSYKDRTKKGVMRLVKGALVEMKAKKNVSNLYILMGETHLEAEASVASTDSKEDTTKMWHFKLGHMSNKD